MIEHNFYKSPWKAIKLILLSLPLVCACIYLILHDTENKLNWFGLCFFGLAIPIGLFNLSDRRPEMTINTEGIFDRLSYGIFNKNKDRGFVKWDSIESASLKIIKNSYRGLPLSDQKYICIKLKEKAIELKKIKANKLSHNLGFADYNIPLMHLKKFDEQKFLELIKAMAQSNVTGRQNLLLTTQI